MEDSSCCNVSESEDEEIVLKGSDLDSILSLHGIKTGTYCTNTKLLEFPSQPFRENPEESVLFVRRDPAVIDVLDSLLSSGLLLDEDAAALADHRDSIFQESSIGRFSSNVPLTISSILLFTGYTSLSRYRWCLLPVFISSISCAVIILMKKYQKFMLGRSISNLIRQMAEISKLLRKTIAHAKETAVSIDSRSILLNNRKSNTALVDIFYAKLKDDLISYIDTLVSFLMAAISFIKEATKMNITMSTVNNNKDIFFLSNLKQEELGLPDGNYQNLTLPKIEELFYLYLLLQSEYLKSLGLAFSSSNDIQRSATLQGVYSFMNQISCILSSANQKLSRGVYSKLTEVAPTRSSNAKEIEYIQLEYVLSRILRDAFSLKHFMTNKESISHEDGKCLELGLSALESSINDYAIICKKIQRLLHNDKIEPNNVEWLTVSKSSTTEPSRTQIEIGKSDYSLADVDNVYISIGDLDGTPSSDPQESDGKYLISYPQNLLVELKSVLEDRREIFRERETEAINRNYEPGIEQQLDPICMKLKGLDKNEERKVQCSLPSSMDNSLTQSSMDYFSGTFCDYSNRKSIAQNAANMSLAWKSSGEECFGDEICDIE